MTRSKKIKSDRLLTDYGDVIREMTQSISAGATVIPKLPEDMTESSCGETAFRLARDLAREADEPCTKARRIRNDVISSGNLSFKLSSGDHFSRIALAYYLGKFQESMDAIEKGAEDRNSVLAAIDAAFVIGMLAPAREVDRKRLARSAQLAQSKIAQGKKAEIAALRLKALSDAIKAVEPNMNLLATSREYAEKIRPSVIERLKLLDKLARDRLKIDPEGKGWPSESTIKTAIRKIKSGKTSGIVLP
jgi:hypothetical protein